MTDYDFNPFTGNLDAIGGGTSLPITSEFDAFGIENGEVIPAGTSLEAFIASLLTTTFYPTYVVPTYSLTANIANGGEIGSEVNLTLTFNYNRGQILGKVVGGIRQPATEQDKRGGLATNYTIDGTDLNLVNTKNINPYTLLDTQTFSGAVDYAQGPQPKDSEGADYQTPLPAGSNTKTNTITALHPYFYGKVTDPQTIIDQALIASGTKVVASSTGDITIDFNSANNEFCWFAIPESSSAKDTWFVNALNNGTIGQPGDWFPTNVIIAVDSPDGYWTAVNYRVYLANYVSEVTDPVIFSTQGN